MRSIKDGLRFHAHAIKKGITSTVFTSNQLIHLYSKHGLLAEAHKLFDEMPERNVFTWNAIIWAYIKTQNLKQARELFDSAPSKDLVTYNSMLSGYINTDGYETNALKLFIEMQSLNDETRIDEFSLTRMLNLSAKLSMESYGKQLHSYMVKTANNLSGFAVSSLVDMYSKCGCFREVCQVFDGCAGVLDLVSKNAMVAACCREGELEMGVNLFWRDLELNDVVSWNTLISGYVQNGCEEDALKLFVHMKENEVRWNEHTIAGLLSACAGLRSLKLGKEVHGWVLKYELGFNPFISSGLVDVYCKCGNLKYAELVYATIGTGNAFSITSMIVGHSSQGNMGEARRLFDSLTEKSSIIWTALFTGYVKSQQCEAVFELLSEFRVKEAMVPDALILISVLGACAIQAALNPGKQIHAYVLRIEIELDEKLLSAMVDMYSKSGNIKYAEKIFQRVTNRDAVIYNIMTAGYAHHGHENQAIQKFEEMLERGVRPDAVTFVALLSACRHCGLVGLRLLLCPLGSNVVVRTACCSVGIVFPVYSTFKAIEKKDQNEQQRWLVYWAAYGSFSLAEAFADKVLYWFPLYYHMKFAFLVWLQLPSTDGAGHLYMRHLRPFLLRHQAKLDQIMGLLYGEMAKFISLHQAEIQLARTFAMKVLAGVRDIIHSDAKQVTRAIEGPTTRRMHDSTTTQPTHDSVIENPTTGTQTQDSESNHEE
ncbi:putative pentatricopeptide repeat-containing protein At3g18840 isoform X2 [Vitis riparia]|uniref:putative pentatricopeptide repeat-containing protein At3g18840 isoform X2 n=1 Tax=Vitis riparia TaxID=96939 RepID=UPI00155B3255|nr:putative pentatricopeptide repeat-containing protein At3g18840 isoform X2 [Vitis riparia]